MLQMFFLPLCEEALDLARLISFLLFSFCARHDALLFFILHSIYFRSMTMHPTKNNLNVYAINPNSTLHAVYTRLGKATDRITMVSLWYDVVGMLKAGGHFDEQNKSMVLCNQEWENVFGMKALHITQVVYIIIILVSTKIMMIYTLLIYYDKTLFFLYKMGVFSFSRFLSFFSPWSKITYQVTNL